MLAAVVAMLGWTGLVHLRVDGFFLIASAYCAGWLAVSALAMGSSLRPLLSHGNWLDVPIGLASALILFVGSRATLWAMCGGFTEAFCGPIHEVYSAFGGSSVWVALALLLSIAPAEEFFWRGLVQPWLRRRMGPLAAVALASVASSLVLLAFFEPLLALAALPTSFVWGLLVEWRKSLWPALISHAAWDLLIFVLLPAV